MAEPTITVEIDTAIGAAYVHLSDSPVAKTEEYSDVINVDLDDLGMVVGIELLDTATTIPLDDLAARYHVKTHTLARLVASLTAQPAAVSTVATASGAGTGLPRRGAIRSAS